MSDEIFFYRVRRPDGAFSSGNTYSGRTVWYAQAPATNVLKRSPPGSVLVRYRAVASEELFVMGEDKKIKKVG